MEEILKQKNKVDRLDERYLDSLLDDEADGFEHTERMEDIYNADRKYIAMLEEKLEIK